MRVAKPIVVTHVMLLDLFLLEETFAYRTPHGWKIPDWLLIWEDRIRGNLEAQQ